MVHLILSYLLPIFGELLRLAYTTEPKQGQEKERHEQCQPTILLVDDQHSIRHMLSAGLKAHGFDVLTAASAEQALALCAGFEGPIDVLLSDISLMPQELWPENAPQDAIPHGVAVAERALQLRPSLKVALLTGLPISI